MKIIEDNGIQFVRVERGSDTNIWKVEFSTDKGRTWTLIGDTAKGQESFPCLFKTATFRASSGGNTIIIGKVVSVANPKLERKVVQKPKSPKGKEQKLKPRIPQPPSPP